MADKIAYLCDGLDPKCSGKIGCFKCLMGRTNSDNICYHTLNPEHAIYGKTLYPSVWAEIRFRSILDGKDIRYFEEWDIKRIDSLIKSGEWMLLPNEPFRKTILDLWSTDKKLYFTERENKP